MAQFRKITVIINPANDPDDHVEVQLRNQFKNWDVEWSIQKTKTSGDAQQFAEQACQNQCDLVVACGGDGTVREVATALKNTGIVMGILPNGTANVLASELGIPYDIEQTISALLQGKYTDHTIDMGSINDEFFILRIGMGYEAEVSVGASRQDKRRFGRLAYIVSAIRQLQGLRSTRYRLTLDGEVVTLPGITCMISNSSNVGIPNVKFSSNTDVSDGLLDVTVIENMYITTVLGFLRNIFVSVIPLLNVQYGPPQHFQAKSLIIESSKTQMVGVDGEPYKRTKRIEVKVIPSSVHIAVPTFDVVEEEV